MAHKHEKERERETDALERVMSNNSQMTSLLLNEIS